jgi:hypothetical protein
MGWTSLAWGQSITREIEEAGGRMDFFLKCREIEGGDRVGILLRPTPMEEPPMCCSLGLNAVEPRQKYPGPCDKWSLVDPNCIRFSASRIRD